MEIQKRAEPLRMVAASFGVSFDTIYRAAKLGRLRTIRIGKRIFVPVAEIERISREGLVPRSTRS